MTDKPVSLSKFRKARARAEARRKADENAVRFGRSKAQKQADEKERDQFKKKTDQHRMEPKEGEDPDNLA